MVLHLMRYCVDTTVHRSLLAEIHDLGRYLFARNFHNRRNQILNSTSLFLADKAGDWQRLCLWVVLVMFTTENARECVQVLERYLGRGSYQPNDYTRGLYYRGVE